MSKIVNLDSLNQERAGKILFEKLFEFMAVSEPKLTFDESLPYEMYKAILRREPFAYPWGTWGIVFSSVGYKPARSDRAMLGASLLEVFGHLGEVYRLWGERIIELQHALMVMVMVLEQCPVRSEFPVVYQQSEDRDSLVITPFGEKQLGLSGSLNLTDRIHEADVPQEIVDRLYGGVKTLSEQIDEHARRRRFQN